ncbi:MAG TPA: PTS sugar transporter subunit IIA, partial [Verrucomicrobiae bacterium]|nr:PTS sugar transporter subunit IIA [Verrucomicrobiae bacterium]
MIPELVAKDRWQAIDELITQLVTFGKIRAEDREVITAVVKKRESSMSTGIGYGIGIPHASTDLVKDVVCAFGQSVTGIDFESLDGKPVTLVVLFLVPQGQFQKYIHTLAGIAKVIHRPEFRHGLREAGNEAALKDLVRANYSAAAPSLPHKQIERRLQAAVLVILPDADVSSVLVRPCPDPKFGDYQSNALMSLAKVRKMNPRQLATDVLAKLDVAEWCEKVDIAGAGFLNFHLKNSALAHSLQSAARGEHLFFEKTIQPRTVVVDFSSPN